MPDPQPPALSPGSHAAISPGELWLGHFQDSLSASQLPCWTGGFGAQSCSLAQAASLHCRIVRLVGVIREWANKNFREEEPRPDSFLERFRGPELQTVTTQQGDSKSSKDGEGKGTKYGCPACGTGGAVNHATGGLAGVSRATTGADQGLYQALPQQGKAGHGSLLWFLTLELSHRPCPQPFRQPVEHLLWEPLVAFLPLGAPCRWSSCCSRSKQQGHLNVGPF